jgi:hypothetical protein
MRSTDRQDLSPLVWLVFPIVSYVLLSIMLLSGFPSVVADRIGGEQGVIENAQVVFLLIFLGLAGTMLCASTPLPHSRLRLWLILLMLGGLYILIEEISWGQHYFGWLTPTWLADLNAQNETNLHNLDRDIFFGIPRLLVLYLPYNLLLAAIYVGGLVYPIVSKGARQSWYWPTPVCIPWAVLTACSSLPLSIGTWMGHPLPVRHGEMQEYFVYGFLVTYLASLNHRRKIQV